MPITWDKLTERYFQYGLDRGVIYIGAAAPVPWNGLLAVDEQGGGGADIIYRDGKIILADVDPSDFAATVKSFFYPDELSTCLGIVEAAENFFVDNQKPTRFGLSYRTLVGSGLSGDQFGYQIHLLYNCLASIGTRSHKTLSETTDPENFDFTIVCTPIKLAGFRPSAHYILDTRGMNSGQVTELENLIYGVGVTLGRLPTPTELFNMMNFGVIMKVHDNNDGTVKITGANQYFTDLGNGKWAVSNVNVDFSPTSYKYDTFDRIAANGWGNTNTGETWTVAGGTSAEYSVDKTGQIRVAATGSTRTATIPVTGNDIEICADLKTAVVAVGANLMSSLVARRLDASNYYSAHILWNTTGVTTFQIRKIVAGVETAIATMASPPSYIAGQKFRVRFQVIGTALRAKIWDAATTEPSAWSITATDASLTTGGTVGVRTNRATSNTNADALLEFDNLSVNANYVISDGGNTQIV